MNESLIAELRSWSLDEFARQNYANMCGHTPQDLMHENLAMRIGPAKTGGSESLVSRAMYQNMGLRGRR